LQAEQTREVVEVTAQVTQATISASEDAIIGVTLSMNAETASLGSKLLGAAQDTQV
jgi:hypothetical protein